MKIQIFTEESNTTANNTDSELRDYYRGLFREVRSLETGLSKYGDTELHIISDQFGIAKGDERAKDVIDTESDKPIEAVQNKLLSAADSDVIVILLSRAVFMNTVTGIWPQVVDRTEKDGIWCIGAAKSVLESIPREQLRDNGCTLITYKRVGVARLGTDAREKLFHAVGKTAQGTDIN